MDTVVEDWLPRLLANGLDHFDVRRMLDGIDTRLPPHRIVRGLGDLAEARHDALGNHSCNNIATVVRPFVADWVADRLLEAS